MSRGHCPAHPDAPLEPVLDAVDRFWGYDGQFGYAQCPRCRSWILDPPPAPDAIGRFYGGYYDETELETQRTGFANNRRAGLAGVDAMRAADLVKRLRREGTPLGADQSLLDVGCGLGAFPRFVRDLSGAEARGLDFNPVCAEFAADVHRIEVDSGELVDQCYDEGRFDCVTSWHCLEHTYDPAAELAEMARITRPGGWLQIEVPTPSPLGRLFRGRWLFLQAPTHLYHLTPAAARHLVERAGFEVVRVTRPWAPTELAGSLVLALGVRSFAPTLMRGKSAPAIIWRLLFLMLLLFDLPVTAALAAIRKSGVVRVLARRSEDKT